MNNYWLAALFDAVGGITRGSIGFFVTGDLADKLFEYLTDLSFHPNRSGHKISITRKEEIKLFHSSVAKLLVDKKKRVRLEKYVSNMSASWKISEDDKNKIRSSDKTVIELAEEYGVTRTTIYNIRKKKDAGED